MKQFWNSRLFKVGICFRVLAKKVISSVLEQNKFENFNEIRCLLIYNICAAKLVGFVSSPRLIDKELQLLWNLTDFTD